jgi:hypothetical protein
MDADLVCPRPDEGDRAAPTAVWIGESAIKVGEAAEARGAFIFISMVATNLVTIGLVTITSCVVSTASKVVTMRTKSQRRKILNDLKHAESYGF